MSLLPNRILPATEPIGRVDENGDVVIEKNWWLLLYNLAAQILGTESGNALPISGVSLLAALDADVADADAVSLRAAVNNALLLAQDTLLPDPQQAPYLLAGPVNAANTNNTTLTGSNNDVQVGTTGGKANQVIYLISTTTAFVTSIGYSLQETFTVGQVIQLVNVGLYSIQISTTGASVDPYRIEMPDSSLDLSGGSYYIRPAEVTTLEYMNSSALFPNSPHNGWVVTSAGIPNSALQQITAGPSGPTTLTIPANAKSFTIYVGGGGGGGGGGAINTNTGGGGGGGGGGGISVVTFTQGSFPNSISVYAGGVGTGGTAASTTGNNGVSGGTSYVKWTDASANTYQISATGGGYGTGGSTTAGGVGGAGGTGNLSNGTAGGNGDWAAAGNSPVGGSAGTNATGAQNTGGGGGGAYNNLGGGPNYTTTNGYAGGSGNPAIVYNSGTFVGGTGGVAPIACGTKGLVSFAVAGGNTGSGGASGCISSHGSPPVASGPGAGGGGGGGGRTLGNAGSSGGSGWYIAITQG